MFCSNVKVYKRNRSDVDGKIQPRLRKRRDKKNPLIIHWIDICDTFDVSMYSFDRARGMAVKPWDKSIAQTDAFMWAADSCIFMSSAVRGRLPRMRIYLSVFVSYW